MSAARSSTQGLTRSWVFRLYVGVLAALACAVFLPAEAALPLYLVLLLTALPGSVMAVAATLVVGTLLFDPGDNGLLVHLSALAIWLLLIVFQGLGVAWLVRNRRA